MLEKELNVTHNIQYQCLAIHMFTIDQLVGEKRLKTRHFMPFSFWAPDLGNFLTLHAKLSVHVPIFNLLAPVLKEKRSLIREQGCVMTFVVRLQRILSILQKQSILCHMLKYQIKWMCEILCTFTVCFYYYKDWCYVMNSPAFVRLCDKKVPYTHPSIESETPTCLWHQ